MTAVLEGEVIKPGRDVEVRVSALRQLDTSSQMNAVTVMLSDVRTRLLAAIAAHDLPGIVAEKAKACTLHEITKQLRLGKDLQLDAAEFVRRAERGLEIGIRQGQARGEVSTRSSAAAELRARQRGGVFTSLPTAKSFYTDSYERRDAGLMAAASDDQFEEVLAEARDEGNLSRANVARKAKSQSTKEPASENDPMIAAQVEQPKPIRKTAAARRVMQDLVVSVSGLAFIVKDTDPAEVDRDAHRGDIESIRQDINVIRRFLKNIEEN